MLTKLFFICYNFLWLLATPFLKRHKRMKIGFEDRLIQGNWQTLPQKRPIDIWIQASSGGEAYLSLELLSCLEEKHSSLHILCTSMTKQGIDILTQGREDFFHAWKLKYKKQAPHIHICYFPLDSKKIMHKAFSLTTPKICILLETELWPNFMKMCKEFQTKLYIVNGRITEKTYNSYKKIQTILAEISPQTIYATKEKDKELYADLFPQATCQFMYNMKFDTTYKELCIAMQASTNNEQKDFPQVAKSTCVFLFASIRKEEENILFPFLLTLHKQKTKSIIILAPRHVARFEAWQEKFNKENIHLINRTACNNNHTFQAGEIILWDKFGELKKLYALADYAFIGGSLVPLGGQNFLEALVYGVIPHTGIYLDNFLWTFETQGQKNLAELNLLALHNSINSLETTFLSLPERKFTEKAKIQATFKAWLKTYIDDTKKIMHDILENS